MAEANVVQGNSRIAWIDIFKGIGILLVVIGHSGIPQKLSWWIWSFHMPMFFFISGFLFNPAKNPEFKTFLSKRLKMLILPYFIYTFFLMVCFYLISLGSSYKLEAGNLSDFLDVFFYGWSGLALWFIPVLFFTEVLYYGIKKIIGSTYLMAGILLVLAVLGYYLGQKGVRLAYKLEVVPTSFVFYGLGSVFSSYYVDFLKKNKSFLLAVLAVVFLVVNIVFCFINNVNLDMCYNKMGNFFYTYLSAVAGIFCMLLGSYFLAKVFALNNPVISSLNYLGRNTLVIVLLHQLIKILLNVFVIHFSIGGITAVLIKQLLFWVLMIGAIKFVNRYLYVTLGRKEPIS